MTMKQEPQIQAMSAEQTAEPTRQRYVRPTVETLDVGATRGKAFPGSESSVTTGS